MKRAIDIEAILAAIPGDNPAGEDLRYSQIYDDIKEARRADDMLDRGDWQREIKTSDWNKVVNVSVESLTKRTKDLQIAAWLMEGLIATEGFEGLAVALRILVGLLENFWDHVYPPIEDDDLDYRAAPFQFMNEKLSPAVRQIALTEKGKTPGYTWLQWAESRDVGLESDTLSRSGEVDEGKKKRRDQLIADGRLTPEEFESALAISSKAFQNSTAENLSLCLETIKRLDEIIDSKFGRQGPSLADLQKAVEDCSHAVSVRKPKRVMEPTAETETPMREEAQHAPLEGLHQEQTWTVSFGKTEVRESDSAEENLWNEAMELVKQSGIKEALSKVLSACYSAPSIRSRNRYRLMMAKLCLEAGRPELARPIIEELNALIEELHLERWESPLWVADVLGTLYQCLIRGERSDEDNQKGQVLFQRLCTMDVTKAIGLKR